MSTKAAIAATTYAALVNEPDPVARAKLLEACFAVDGRMITRNSVLRGRAAVAAVIDAFVADPRGLTARLTSAIDAGEHAFRFSSIVDVRDGTQLAEFHDSGEIDADGRIALLITFNGPLPPA